MATRSLSLLVGTRKGAFVLKTDPSRRKWEMQKPLFFGHVIQHFVGDPRAPKVRLIGAKTGHLGPTMFRSLDGGKTFKEASRPPAYPKDKRARAVDTVFWLTPGHPSEPRVWYAGVAPAGLFRSEDDGDTWESVTGFNDHPMNEQWLAGGAAPDGQFLHSVLVDPRDPNHLYLGVSIGGFFESTDRGRSWKPLNKGCEANFLPDGAAAEFGHDPHCVALHPLEPDVLYQQNHCGIYRMDRTVGVWSRIGRAMPKQVGDIGFPMTLHPRDPAKAFVFPMDGTDVWPRTSPGGKPAVYATSDSGRRWRRLDKGLPESNAWLTVKRQAMCSDFEPKLGLYFGTTSGEIWGSRNEGESWSCLARHLPHVYSVEIAP